MRIIVTGGCGFIGSNLIRKLLNKENIHILNIDKFGYASNHSSIEEMISASNKDRYQFKKIDLADKNTLIEICESFQPDLVMNLACRKSC